MATIPKGYVRNPRGGTTGLYGSTLPSVGGFGQTTAWGGSQASLDARNQAVADQANQQYLPGRYNGASRGWGSAGMSGGGGSGDGGYGSGSSPWDYFNDLYSQIREEQTGRAKTILGGYEDRFDRNMARLSEAGQAGEADINRVFDEQEAQQVGRLVDRGWGESTVRDTMHRGIGESRSRELGRLREDIAAQKSAMDAQLSGDTLQFAERIDYDYPSLDFMANLAKEFGQGGGGGGGGYGYGGGGGGGGGFQTQYGGAGAGGITNIGGDSGVVNGGIAGLTFVSPNQMGYNVPSAAAMSTPNWFRGGTVSSTAGDRGYTGRTSGGSAADQAFPNRAGRQQPLTKTQQRAANIRAAEAAREGQQPQFDMEAYNRARLGRTDRAIAAADQQFGRTSSSGGLVASPTGGGYTDPGNVFAGVNGEPIGDMRAREMQLPPGGRDALRNMAGRVASSVGGAFGSGQQQPYADPGSAFAGVTRDSIPQMDPYGTQPTYQGPYRSRPQSTRMAFEGGELPYRDDLMASVTGQPGQSFASMPIPAEIVNNPAVKDPQRDERGNIRYRQPDGRPAIISVEQQRLMGGSGMGGGRRGDARSNPTFDIVDAAQWWWDRARLVDDSQNNMDSRGREARRQTQRLANERYRRGE